VLVIFNGTLDVLLREEELGHVRIRNVASVVHGNRLLNMVHGRLGVLVVLEEQETLVDVRKRVLWGERHCYKFASQQDILFFFFFFNKYTSLKLLQSLVKLTLVQEDLTKVVEHVVGLWELLFGLLELALQRKIK